MTTTNVQVKVTGPLFQKGGEPVRRAVQDTIQELVELGEQQLDQFLRPRPAGFYLSVQEAGKGKASTGHYRRNLHATVSNLHGRIDDGGVVYGSYLEGTSSRNQTTRFKGYSSFRRTGQYLEKIKGRTLQKHIEKAIKELNG